MSFACRNCGIEKPASEYRVHKRGYRIGKCRECERVYGRAWYRSRGDAARDVKRRYMRKLRREKPDILRAVQRKSYANRRDRIRAANRGHIRRIFWSRALRLKGIAALDLARLWRTQRGRCALTGRRLDRSAEIDHTLLRSRGGTDEITNLRWVCKQVNRTKRDLTDAEFLTLCVDVLRVARIVPIKAKEAA